MMKRRENLLDQKIQSKKQNEGQILQSKSNLKCWITAIKQQNIKLSSISLLAKNKLNKTPNQNNAILQQKYAQQSNTSILLQKNTIEQEKYKVVQNLPKQDIKQLLQDLSIIPQSLLNITKNNSKLLNRINTINSVRYQVDDPKDKNKEHAFKSTHSIQRTQLDLIERVIQLQSLVSGIISGMIKISEKPISQRMIKIPKDSDFKQMQSNKCREKNINPRSKSTDHKIASKIKSTKMTRNQVEFNKRQFQLDNKKVIHFNSNKRKNVLRITTNFKSKIQKKNEQKKKKEQFNNGEQQASFYDVRRLVQL